LDFSNVSAAAEDGAVLELKDPAGEPILKDDGSPVTITLAGTESKKWKKARNAVGDRYLKNANPRNSSPVRTMDEALSDQAFQLASVTLAWDGVIVDGQELPCTHDNAKKIYLQYDWVREQVDLFVGERRNFWKASSAA
jgi:hypothetical protein